MHPRLLSLIGAGMIVLSRTGSAQTVIPLISYPADGRLGIALKLGTNANEFTYLLDTGSCGFFTACGTNAAWAGLVSGSYLPSSFHISYGTGALAYKGKVVLTDVTLSDTDGHPVRISNVKMGIITNQPYPGWNDNINHVVGEMPSPIPPEPNSETNDLFYGTLGAGLFQTISANGSLGSVIGQIPLTNGLTKGFIIHTGGSASDTPTLTVGLTQDAIASFPVLIRMSPATGTVSNDNGTTVTLYPEAQTVATYLITNGAYSYATLANFILDTGGLDTYLTTGTDINPPASLLSSDGSQIMNGASFSVQVAGTPVPGGVAAAQGLNWRINPTGTSSFVNLVQIFTGSGPGSVNSGITLFYQYDVLFDTEHGIIGFKSAFPLPTLRFAFAAGTSQLQLFWPTSVPGFGLQSATTLANGGNWQDSGLTPTQTNGQNVVTVEATLVGAFFRLRK